MIESYEDWINCQDPEDFLDLVGSKPLRRQRLFVCACCRRVWHLLTNQIGRSAVEMAEAYADGAATEQQKSELDREIGQLLSSFGEEYSIEHAAVEAAAYALDETTEMAPVGAGWAAEAAGLAAKAGDPNAMAARGLGIKIEKAAQCDILRDIFSLPFARVHFHNAWRKWDAGRVKQVAQDIYHVRNFERMTELADSLEAAGCTLVDILRHCRESNSHVRGCWVLDLVLGKP